MSVAVALTVLIALVFVAGLLLVGLSQRPVIVAETVTPRAATIHTYTSPRFRYALRYPAGWTYQMDLPERVTFRRGSEEVTVSTTDRVSEQTLIPASPVEFQLRDGTTALRFRDYNPTTGQPLDRVVVERPDGLFHELRGYGTVFETIVQTFTLRP